jgi:hypothetical protein
MGTTLVSRAVSPVFVERQREVILAIYMKTRLQRRGLRVSMFGLMSKRLPKRGLGTSWWLFRRRAVRFLLKSSISTKTGEALGDNH